MGINNDKKILMSRTFTKIIVSFFMIIFFTILMVSTIVYYKFTRATISDVQVNIQEKLSQNMNQLEFMRNQVNGVGEQLLNDSDIIDYLYLDMPDSKNEYIVSRKLMQTVDANPMINSIYVYNGGTKKFESNIGSSGSPIDKEMGHVVTEYDGRSRLKFTPMTFTDVDGSEKGIISIVFNDCSNLDSDKSKSMLIINLKADYVRDSFTLLSNTKDSNVLIIDNNGDVICDSNFKYFGKNVSSFDYVRDILKSDRENGYMIVKNPGGKFLVNYVRSAANPFIFIYNTDYNKILHENNALLRNIILICLVILLISALISVLAAYNIYLPFYKLIKSVKLKWNLRESETKSAVSSGNDAEYLMNAFLSIIDRTNKLEDSIKNNVPFIKNMFLKVLLEGNMLIPSKDVNARVKELKLNISNSRASVILFSIDGFRKIYQIQDQLMGKGLISQIESIIYDALSKDNKIEVVSTAQDLVAVIANVDNAEEFTAGIKDKIRFIQEQIKVTLGVSVTAAIGLMTNSIEDINMSYNDCLELIKYRFVYGYNSILDRSIVTNIVNKKITSVDKIKKKIVQNVKNCNIDLVRGELDRLFEMIADNQYDYIRLTINQLALDIIMAVESILVSEDYDIDFGNIYTDINDIDTLEDIKTWFISYCSDIIEKLKEKKNTKQLEMVKIAVSYVKDNFYKPEISTECVSDIVGLTPGYFGKLFSEYMGKSLNEYIVELRMIKAGELLKNSEVSVNDVAIDVGYTNQSYFTATFKKHFGVTPNQYKIDYKKAQGLK